jgi:formylglycine-generating enzyme required for sulfatase activity
MVLVDGEYCTFGDGRADEKAVEHGQCLKEWYAPQNKKRVCEEFAPGAKCLGKKVHKRYCIDRYEYANVKGERPEVMNRFHQAQVKCAAEGKRLCTESEWTLACEGPEMKPFPYGYKRDATKCNGDVEWDAPNMSKVAQRDPGELARLWQGVPSGQPECVSDYGVYDLPGNADEVVASETFESGWRSKYESVHTGGPWYKGVRNQCRPKIYTHDEGFYYYFLSFRCCAEPDGEPNDPRTPHQKKEGWDMKKVEALAGVTVAEMQQILRKKEKDPTCGCKDSDIRCKTLCGTLLGPDARDRKR